VRPDEAGAAGDESTHGRRILPTASRGGGRRDARGAPNA
jgi:hypothetical protein